MNEAKARLMSRGGWGQVGSDELSPRYSLPITDGRRRRARCQLGDGECPNRRTHYGMANGVALLSGCQFHIAGWVRP